MSDGDPKLRHEFVGMMFAITIGEVGLQVAAVVQAGHLAHYLPAYGHLILATTMIAASWVGWSVSIAPGARQDVRGVFQWAFVVLLLDVSMVITYFILVRTVDFEKESSPRIAPASTVAGWVFAIFLLYLVWDLITKIVMNPGKLDRQWVRFQGSRMIPTIVCFIISLIVWWRVKSADIPHWLSEDFALFWLALLFRAAKEFMSNSFPRQETSESFFRRTKASIVWTVVCACGLAVGIVATTNSWRLPLPAHVIEEINKPVPEMNKASDNPQKPSTTEEGRAQDQHEQSPAPETTPSSSGQPHRN